MEASSDNKYNLDRRTFIFSKKVRDYVDRLPRKMTNIEIGKQLIRSAGSVGANYIKANEALSKKDFLLRIKICKKEAKESRYWLELSLSNSVNTALKSHLISESTELLKIFATIVNKTKL